MSRHQLLILFVSVCVCSPLTYGLEKWSRQVDAIEPDAINDSFDWVPVAHKSDNDNDNDNDDDSTLKDRSSNARVLTYSQSFPAKSHFGDFPKAVNNAILSQRDVPFEFSYAQFPPQSSLRQPRPLMKANTNTRQQEATQSQSFMKFETPFGRQTSNRPSDLASVNNNNYQIQHAFGGGAQATLFSSPVYNQQPLFPSEFHPIPQKPISQPQQQKPLQQIHQQQQHRQQNTQQQNQKNQQQQNIIEDSLSLGHFFSKSKKPTSSPLQSVNAQVYPTNPSGLDTLQSFNRPNNFQYNAIPTASAPSAPSSLRPLNGQGQQQQQDIQVLYVPIESLYGGQPQGQQSNSFINAANSLPYPTIDPFQVNQFYTPEPLLPALPYTTTTTSTTTTTAKPQTTTLRRPANIYENYLNLNPTVKPKPKAHQPALAMFMSSSLARPTQADVVDRLKNVKTIDVVDSPSQIIPEIFVGPAGMPTPHGYSKFELPYLSQLQGIYNLRDMPFYVAPMSYRTPAGFSKIFLPEPHVGSIVINLSKAKSSAPVLTNTNYQAFPKIPVNPYYNLPLQSQTEDYISSTTARPKSTAESSKTYRPQVIQTNTLYEPSNHNYIEEYTSTTSKPRTTTQSIKSHNRGNKYSYYYEKDQISEISSTHSPIKDRTKKKRPQHIPQEQTFYSQQPQVHNPYTQFNPMPGQIRDIDLFKVSPNRPSTALSTSTTPAPVTTTTPPPTTTTTTTPSPQTYFAYNTSPEVEYHSTRGHLNPQVNPQSNQISQEQYHSSLTTPSQSSQFYGNPQLLENNQFFQTSQPTSPSMSSITAEEEYRMKHYYRQQDAFRNLPKVPYQTTPDYDQEHYSPFDFEYGILKAQGKGTSTSTTTTTTTTTTPKPKITFYSPTQAPQINEHLSSLTQNQEFNSHNLPTNHRPTYQNEVTDGPVEYDPNPYQLPSELPPLTPNLPGLVNNLLVNNLLENSKQNSTEYTDPTHKKEDHTARPTRRPINRIRKPVTTKVPSSVSYSESESSSRRPPSRVRRPFGVKAAAYINSNGSENDITATSPSTTPKRPSISRKPFIRNPNRIRYQPTPEERETLRIKTRRKHKHSSKKSETEDLEYQRDVLNQNYPNIKPTIRTTNTEVSRINEPTTEVPTSESQQIFTVTPHNAIDNEQSYTGTLLEPIQIAQQYNHYSDNYGPGYFPNQEDLNPTESFIRNEIHPVYTTVRPEQSEAPIATTTTTTTTATKASIQETTTRRSPFLRRNYPRLRTTTTTETPTTTTIATTTEDEKPLISFHIRNRVPPRKVHRLRTRNKRPPHPASSTAKYDEYEEQGDETQKYYQKLSRYNSEPSSASSTSQPDEDEDQVEETQNTYQKLNHHNIELSSATSTSQPDEDEEQEEETQKPHPKANHHNFGSSTYEIPKRRYKTRFQLEAQESQWSPSAKAGPVHNFKPINLKVYSPNQNKFENEPDIITAEPKTETDNYEIKVSANYDGNKRHPQLKQPNLRPEKTFAELLEEVMGKAPQDQLENYNKSEVTSTDNNDFESQKTSNDQRPNRRGKWKKVRVSPITRLNKEHLETAESQNWNSKSLNVVDSTAKPVDFSTTPEVSRSYTGTTSATVFDTTKQASNMDTSTIKTDIPTTMFSALNMDTGEAPQRQESATRRMDTFREDDDLVIEPSLFSEVKKQLHDLFAIEESEDSAITPALTANNKQRQEYKQIIRIKPESTTTASITTEPPLLESSMTPEEKHEFHKQLMEQIIYATSQTMIEPTSEAEICYRGRCLKSDDLPANHKLN